MLSAVVEWPHPPSFSHLLWFPWQEYLSVLRKCMLMLKGIQRPEVDEDHEVQLQRTIDDFNAAHATFVGHIEVEKHCAKEGFASLTRFVALAGSCSSRTSCP